MLATHQVVTFIHSDRGSGCEGHRAWIASPGEATRILNSQHNTTAMGIRDLSTGEYEYVMTPRRSSVIPSVNDYANIPVPALCGYCDQFIKGTPVDDGADTFCDDYCMERSHSMWADRTETFDPTPRDDEGNVVCEISHVIWWDNPAQVYEVEIRVAGDASTYHFLSHDMMEIPVHFERCTGYSANDIVSMSVRQIDGQ